ncbi:hypothetical protein [Verrucosispora sp. WMMD573]|uniref:hypothetical protein n=1 Tax=Verrucosispora sp. WMMD573 TaxID=3015149 RepID=UPI00248C243C|nr:hypothetical protein [Verrucosispora sp. WMMD573]WBB52449.1 hypothetical protein O7601_17840 [Verrucosispora sp. WMMD573]
MTTSESDADPTQLWRITIPVIASASEVDALTDRLVETLCPDPNHEGPCPTPWALHVTDGNSLSKAEQRRQVVGLRL